MADKKTSNLTKQIEAERKALIRLQQRIKLGITKRADDKAKRKKP